tara:strand:- start:234 stop:377 length:144 start_codon:yes stop_codon:yes gene_type:complete
MLTVCRLVTPVGRTAEIIEYRASKDIVKDWLVKGYNVEVIREELENY